MSKINIFISHTSKDHDFVWELAKRMKKDLKDIAEIFVDDWEIKVGDSIVRKIDEAAQNADFFIIVLSKYSIKQEWVQREIDIAFTKLIQKKSKILPVWLEISEKEVPPILFPLKAAVFKTRVIIDEKEYQKLIEPILDHEKAKSLLKFQESVLDNIKHLDLALQKEKPTRHEVQFALNLIKESPVYERYFFPKLRSLEWFDILKLEGFFSPEKVPCPEPADEEGFYTIPYWNVLDYLERVSQKVKEPGNEIYIDKLLEIIKEVTEHHKQTKNLDNYHIWSSFIRIISNLPNEKITEEVIDLIPIWLDSRFDTGPQSMKIMEKLFPKFLTDNLEDIKKAEKILSYLTEIKKKENRKVLVVDNSWLKVFFKKYLKDIGEKCSTENVVNLFVKRIKEIASSEYEGTLESFYYKYEKLEYLNPVELFSYALSRILLIKAKKEPQKTAEVLKSLFEEKLPIFTKITLFILGQNLNQKDFKDIFWKIIKDKGVDIFRGASTYWGDELKKVLENLGPLSDEQQKLLEEKIEEAANRYIESLEKENEKERRKAFFKQKIYKALSYDEKFNSLYEEMKKITKADAELRPVIKVEVKTGWGKSPLCVEEILKMDNTELANYLIKFKTEDPWEGPSVEALAETLKTAVKTSPEKFTKDLTAFLNVRYLYIVKFLEGLKEAVTEDEPIAYKEVFDFVEKYVNRNEFWQNKFIVEDVTHEWVINAFCFFIKEVLQTETFPIEQFFERIKDLIHLMMKRVKIKKAEEISEYVFYSINTPTGRLIETYIKLILEILNSLYDKKEQAVKDFVERFKELLNQSIIEAYTLFGMYFLNFYFHIDKNFSIETVKSLKKKDERWEAFMEGYCYYVRNIYKEVYELMKEHYEASLEHNFKSKVVKESIIGHISIGYLVDLENLKPPSLFYKLVEQFDPDDINKIIWVLWNQRDYLKEDDEKNRQIKKRILDFWKFVYEKLKDKKEEELSEGEKEILSNIVDLTCFLPELREPYIEWLKKSAKSIKDPVTFLLLLEELKRLRDIGDKVKAAKNIGGILLEVSSAKQPITYPKDKIEAFIKYLYNTPDNDVKDIAKKICENYVKNGIFEFKEVCEKCS